MCTYLTAIKQANKLLNVPAFCLEKYIFMMTWKVKFELRTLIFLWPLAGILGDCGESGPQDPPDPACGLSLYPSPPSSASFFEGPGVGNQPAYPSSSHTSCMCHPPIQSTLWRMNLGKRISDSRNRFGTFWARSSWVLYAYGMFLGGAVWWAHPLALQSFYPVGRGETR